MLNSINSSYAFANSCATVEIKDKQAKLLCKITELDTEKQPVPLISLHASNAIKGAAFGAFVGVFNAVSYGTLFLAIAYLKSKNDPKALENFSINNASSLIMHAAKFGGTILGCVGAYIDVEEFLLQK